MLHSKAHIEEGDLVILYMATDIHQARDNMTAITVTPGQVFHNKYGRYPHENLIGQSYGSKIHSPPPHSGYLHLLRPTPELWTLSLPHRTQILYLPDISYITMRLGIRVGGKIIEAGTGSGSMTHSLSRSVGPSGQVLSFEYHQPRYETALIEFKSHALRNVRLQHRNVCKDGFGDEKGVEAVFLDLPAPWEAVPHVVKNLRSDVITKICCFSPCLEQVLKTVTSLKSEGFFDISTQEVLTRTHELVQLPVNTSNLSSISSIVSELKEHEKRKEERRLLQIKTARENNRKAKGLETSQEVSVETETGLKRRLEQTKNTEPLQRDNEEITDSPKMTAFSTEPANVISSTVFTKPSPEMKGHTSYLTFAAFYPESIRLDIARQRSAQTATGNLRAAELVWQVKEKVLDGQETEYGDEGLDEALGSLTEEQMEELLNNK
nr:tRNA (adenine-N(1)-)-methyltransferase catalytic subunit TRM61 [Cryptococcus depauperatus CBS 7841]